MGIIIPVCAQSNATFLLLNPGFDYQSTGWTLADIKRDAFWFPEHYPRFTESCCYFMSSASDVHQSIENVPDGEYIVSCMGYFRNGVAEQAYELTRSGKNEITAKLYANNDAVPLVDIIQEAQSTRVDPNDEAYETILPNGKWIPNHVVSTEVYFKKGIYANRVATTVRDGKLRIGIKVTKCQRGGWYAYDNFHITYNGSSSALANFARGKVPLYRAYLHSLDSIVGSQDHILQTKVGDRFRQVVSSRPVYTSEDYQLCRDSIVTGMANATQTIDSLKQGITSRLLFTDKMEGNAPDADIIRMANDVNDFIFSTFDLVQHLSERINVLTAMTDDYIAGSAPNTVQMNTATPDNPIDVTNLYVRNPRIHSTLFWKCSSLRKPADAPFIYFLWSSNGNFYQDIDHIPNGIYTVSCQGFFRDTHTLDAYEGYWTGKNRQLAVLYANKDKVPLSDIMSASQLTSQCSTDEEQIGNSYTPFGYESARVYFDKGLYPNFVTTVVTNGKLRIGVRCDTWIDDIEYAFSNFKLLYKGKKR